MTYDNMINYSRISNIYDQFYNIEILHISYWTSTLWWLKWTWLWHRLLLLLIATLHDLFIIIYVYARTTNKFITCPRSFSSLSIWFFYVYLLSLILWVSNTDFGNEEGESALSNDPYFIDQAEYLYFIVIFPFILSIVSFLSNFWCCKYYQAVCHSIYNSLLIYEQFPFSIISILFLCYLMSQ